MRENTKLGGHKRWFLPAPGPANFQCRWRITVALSSVSVSTPVMRGGGGDFIPLQGAWVW